MKNKYKNPRMFRDLLNETLCKMVKDATGLKVLYNKNDNTICINDKETILFTDKEKRKLIELISL